MKNTILFYKLGYKFLCRYFKEYFITFLKPLILLIALFVICILFCNSAPYFTIFFALFILLPASCYLGWKLYVINYALIPLSFEFIKNGANKNFETIIKSVNQKKLISFVSFSCVIFLIPVFLLITVIICNSKDILSMFSSQFFWLFVLICLISIIPFVSLSLQAFYFKKNNETYFDILKNCYNKIDKDGFILLVLYSIINLILNIVPVLSILLIFIVPLFSAMFTFWYYSRLNKKH